MEQSYYWLVFLAVTWAGVAGGFGLGIGQYLSLRMMEYLEYRWSLRKGEKSDAS